MRQDRSGEIDYYEELGVERNASPEEIRDAFRALVRLLHPDHQQDENLKAIAEKQLRKLNRIYAVLSDADRRRRYDQSREGELRPPTIIFSPVSRYKARELITRFIWICTAVMGLMMIVWLATDSPSTPPYPVPERAAASAKAAPQPVPLQPAESGSAAIPSAQAAVSGEVSQLRAALRAARSERDEAKRELDELRGRQEAAVRQSVQQQPLPPVTPAAAPLTSASTALADQLPPRLAAAPAFRSAPSASPPPDPPLPLRSSKVPGSEAHQFAGFWFFAKSGQPNRNKNLYYPEFIEATLTEQNGVVHGRYRSRYRIIDRAISPDVNFEFSGTPGNGTIVCSWAGPGGAKGQLTLRMVGENEMKVDWTASDIGSVQGLASGTAVLTRRLE